MTGSESFVSTATATTTGSTVAESPIAPVSSFHDSETVVWSRNVKLMTVVSDGETVSAPLRGGRYSEYS